MILITKTWEETTYDDDGDPLIDDGGFEFEDEPFEFRHLVDELRMHPLPSSWPLEGSTFEWVSTEPEMDRYGVWRQTSVHYAQKNPTRNAKYWRWALKAAGVIKGAKA
jgi:hypothetical protein